MMSPSCIVVGHAFIAGAGRKLIEPLKVAGCTVGEYINYDGLCASSPPQLKSKSFKDVEQLVKYARALVLEVSEYSTSNGSCCASERFALEVARYNDIPCILVVNSYWHLNHAPYLKDRALVPAIRLIIIRDRTVSAAEEKALRDEFLQTNVVRYTRRIAKSIAEQIKMLSDERADAVHTATDANN